MLNTLSVISWTPHCSFSPRHNCTNIFLIIGQRCILLRSGRMSNNIEQELYLSTIPIQIHHPISAPSCEHNSRDQPQNQEQNGQPLPKIEFQNIATCNRNGNRKTEHTDITSYLRNDFTPDNLRKHTDQTVGSIQPTQPSKPFTKCFQFISVLYFMTTLQDVLIHHLDTREFLLTTIFAVSSNTTT